MNNTTGNVALRATNNTQVNMDMVQVDYICRSFEVAKDIQYDKKGNQVATGLEPLIIRRNMCRLSSGYADLIEIHGYYSQKVAETAVLKLKDSNLLSENTIVEMVAENGMVTALKFIKPLIHIHNK